MSKKVILDGERPRLFSPSVIKGLENMRGKSIPESLGSLADTNILSTSSFRYDSAGSPLKSTQELPVDFSKFENHTFFNSAVSKVNIAFDKMVNEYPFDGTLKEVEAFEDSITGYEKYILNIFPKNVGYLIFSGTQLNEDPASGFAAGLGTYISVVDSEGKQFPEFSKNSTGKAVLDPGNNSLSIDAQVFIPDIINGNQIIWQKLYNDTTFNKEVSYTLALSQSSDISLGTLLFAVTSGSITDSITGSIEKGKFTHISAVFDRSVTSNKLHLFANSKILATSSNSIFLDTISTPNSNFLIGSGSSFLFLEDDQKVKYEPKQTLSGALDDFRFYHKIRTPDTIDLDYQKSIYAQDNLALYFKFDEPYGTFSPENIALDSSGNSLHSYIYNYSQSLRNTSSNPQTNMPLQDSSMSPVLYPSYNPVSALNLRLLTSAFEYDDVNPNLITRLVPPHYFSEGQEFQGYNDMSGTMGNPYTASSIPGSGKLGTGQILTSFLLIWSKFFDEIKMFLDHFSELVHVDYDSDVSVTDKFLPILAKYYGLDLPGLFTNVNLQQFIYGQDIRMGAEKSLNNINFVQNTIWRRMLINLQDVIRSKGTQESIKALLRSAGINVENVFTMREYGGPTRFSLASQRDKRSAVSTMLDFSGSLSSPAGIVSTQGIPSTKPFLMSPFLSGSRIEVGYPASRGAMVDKVRYSPHGISNEPADGLFTSGSFTYEGLYRFQPIRSQSYDGRILTTPFNQRQSLARFHVTGTNSSQSRHGVVANLVAVSGSTSSSLHLYVRSSRQTGASEPILSMSLNMDGESMFDGKLWNISFGRYRSDDVRNVLSNVSSTYFLRCGNSHFGDIRHSFTTTSPFKEQFQGVPTFDIFQALGSTFNSSGAFICIGSQSIEYTNAVASFLNNSTFDNIVRTTNFEGRIGQIRFWSEGIEETSWLEHVRNFESLGVEDPHINFNFMTHASGTFQRMRMNASTDQRVTESNSSGGLTVFDFSQATVSGTRGGPWRSQSDRDKMSYHMSGTGFELSKGVIRPQQHYYSILSPKFDVRSTDKKVRVRSFYSASNFLNNPYATTPPVYEVRKSETPTDDKRFTIDYSTVRALDEDIIKIFSSLEFFDDALGNPNLLFSENYPDLDSLREVYFKRLTEKLDLRKFFDFYKWFDSSFGILIEQLIPARVTFMGINFVIESHVLERHKNRYLYDEIYLKSIERDSSRGNLLLSQFVATVKKM